MLYLVSRSDREMLPVDPSLLFLLLTFFFSCISTSAEQTMTWKHNEERSCSASLRNPPIRKPVFFIEESS